MKLNTEAGKLGDRLKARKAEEKKLREDLVKSQVGKQNTVKIFYSLLVCILVYVPFLRNILLGLILGYNLSIVQAERETVARRVTLLQEEVESKRRELEQFSANDPERYEALSTCYLKALSHACNVCIS